MVDERPKGHKEAFARFFESPTREGLRELLVNNTGEYADLDFKAEFLESDKMAKHILGMANKSGGVIVFGVATRPDRSLHPVGLPELSDKNEMEKQLGRYLPQGLARELIDFAYSDSEYPSLVGKSFRVVLVEHTPEYIPFMPRKESELLKRHHIYTRDGTETVLASYEQVQDIINRRLETGYSSADEFALRKQLSELGCV